MSLLIVVITILFCILVSLLDEYTNLAKEKQILEEKIEKISKIVNQKGKESIITVRVKIKEIIDKNTKEE